MGFLDQLFVLEKMLSNSYLKLLIFAGLLSLVDFCNQTHFVIIFGSDYN